MRLRWVLGTNPIFMYCAICRRTIFYPLNHLLFKTNFFFWCGLRLLWKQVIRKNLLCSHRWEWVGCASSGSIAVLKERLKRLPFNIQFHNFDLERVTDWFVCQKCDKVRKVVSSKRAARSLKKLANEIVADRSI